jgi:hypothetical protein
MFGSRCLPSLKGPCAFLPPTRPLERLRIARPTAWCTVVHADLRRRGCRVRQPGGAAEIWPMRCKGMASERGWKAPFRSGAQNTLGLPQAGPRGPLEPFQGIITSGGANGVWSEFCGPARARPHHVAVGAYLVLRARARRPAAAMCVRSWLLLPIVPGGPSHGAACAHTARRK